MKKDYKTIREVVGPLMMVDCVENVKYEKFVEIHEADGSDTNNGKNQNHGKNPDSNPGSSGSLFLFSMRNSHLFSFSEWKLD